MNINELHSADKKVSAVKIESKIESIITAIKILKNETLSKHITKIPAILICITGHTDFETEKGDIQTLKTGDYVNIPPNVTHWLNAIEESHLLLIK